MDWFDLNEQRKRNAYIKKRKKIIKKELNTKKKKRIKQKEIFKKKNLKKKYIQKMKKKNTKQKKKHGKIQNNDVLFKNSSILVPTKVKSTTFWGKARYPFILLKNTPHRERIDKRGGTKLCRHLSGRLEDELKIANRFANFCLFALFWNHYLFTDVDVSSDWCFDFNYSISSCW